MLPSKSKAFTLVELIITIAVIAVLAVTAFLVITKWISKSRDSARMQDISIIQQGLETEIVNTKTYPMPDNYTGIYDTGNALAWYQGEFTDNVRNQIVSLSKLPKDPQGNNYGYSLSNDKEQYQLRAFLENTSYKFNYTDRVSAATQISKINGNYNGFLVTKQSYSTGNVYSLWNIPTMFLWSGTVFSSGTNYVNENNKPIDNTTNIRFADVGGLYDNNTSNDSTILDNIVTSFSGTNGVSTQNIAQVTMKTAAGGVNVVLSSCVIAKGNSSTNPGLSCADIRQVSSCAPNDIYRIKPDANPAVQTYCDISGGGRTLVVKIGGSTEKNHLNTAAVGILTSFTQTSSWKFSDAFINAFPKTIGYKFVCGNTPAMNIPSSCVFGATSQVVGSCIGNGATAMGSDIRGIQGYYGSPSPPGPVYGYGPPNLINGCFSPTDGTHGNPGWLRVK